MPVEARRHHYIPRFLLKGFASRTVTTKKQSKHFLFQYLKNGHISEPSIKDVALQFDFHGKPNSSNLQNIISLEENKYARLTDRLRKGQFDALLTRRLSLKWLFT